MAKYVKKKIGKPKKVDKNTMFYENP